MRFVIYPVLTLAGIAISQTILALILDRIGLVGPRFTVQDLVIGGGLLALAGGLTSYVMAQHIVEQGLKGARTASTSEDQAFSAALRFGAHVPPRVQFFSHHLSLSTRLRAATT